MGAMQLPQRWIRIAGLVLVVIPLGILLLFAIGETAGGDLYGLQHLAQAVPLAVVAFVAWRWPGVVLEARVAHPVLHLTPHHCAIAD